MVATQVYREFLRVGNDLFLAGINNSHSGNMSVRLDGSIAITHTGSKLHRLDPDEIVVTALRLRDAQATRASSDLEVHRAIYLHTPHRAVIHAHPPHAVALSFTQAPITPVDLEGRYYFGEIPVVDPQGEIGTPRLGVLLAEALRRARIVMIKGHGSVAAGHTLDECLHWTTAFESASRLKFLALAPRA